MQHKENYQHVLVSKTVLKRLVHAHAVCSECGLPADIHGGYLPCRGAYIIVNMEIINAVATSTPEPDRRPTGPIDNIYRPTDIRTCTQCSIERMSKDDGFRLRE